MIRDTPPHLTWALLDTGIAADALPGNARLLEHVDLVDGDGLHPHGAQMAGIVASLVDELHMVSIRILDDQGDLRGPDPLEAAIDSLLARHHRLNIRVVLIPIATRSHYLNDNTLREDAITSKIRRLTDEGVMIICPAGNAFSRYFQTKGPEGMAWPAILRETISVGATTQRLEDGAWCEAIAPHSQRLMATDDHPGTTIFSSDPMAEPTTLPGPISDKARTSGAAAHVSGLVVNRLRECPDSSRNDIALFLRNKARALQPTRRALRSQDVRYPALTRQT